MNTSTVHQQTHAVEPPAELRAGLADLQESLARLEVPFAFYYDLENYLTDDERAKLSLFAAVKRGLSENAEVFSPKRYGTIWTNDKLHAESTLWLRVFHHEKISAAEAAHAFEAHLASGHRFPTPAQILTLVEREPCQ